MVKNSKFFIIIFLIASVLTFPCSLCSVSTFFTTAVRLFSLSSLSAIAAGFILFQYANLKNKLSNNLGLAAFLFIFLIITVIQFFTFDNSSFNDFFFSIFWISVPLFIYLFSDTVKKYLPIYIYILWIADLLICFFTPGEKVGITGNRNWHAIFLLTVLLFSMYQTYIFIRYLKKINTLSAKLLISAIILITVIFTGYSIYLFYMCESRAATLTAIIMLLIFIDLKFINDLKTKLKKLKFV